MKKRIRIQGLLIFLALLALFFFAKYLLPDAAGKKAPDLAFICGITLILTGYFFRIISRGYKAEINPGGKTLVTRGPYSLMRNPMYFGTLLIGLGVVFSVLRLAVGLLFLLIYLVIYIPQINLEEKLLAGRFGDAFRDYCRITPKFFPNLKLLFQGQALGFKLAWVKRELPSLIATLILVIAIKIWWYFK